LTDKYQITCAAELESLAAFRRLIDRACQQQRISQSVCYDLKLAVDEACANIITYGYAGMSPGSVTLELTFDPQKALVTLTDFGYPFEPYEPPTPDPAADLDDLPPGAFGLFFIYRTMDEIDYETAEDGNHLRFVKWLHPSSAG